MEPTGARRRVLFVAPELPHPPFTGAHTRPLSIIRALVRDHDVTVVGAAPPDANLSALKEAGASVEALAKAPYARSPARMVLSRARRLASPVPLISRGYSPLMGRFVERAARRVAPDAVHLVSMYSCGYRLPGVPAVVDLLDVVSGLCAAAVDARPLRYGAAFVQELTSQRLEMRELADMAAVLAINDDDAARLRRLGIDPTVVPLTTAVPSDGEVGADVGGGHAGAGPLGTRPLALLFVGNFAHEPNRAAAVFLARDLVPALARRRLDAVVTIAGRRAEVVARPGHITYVADPPDLGSLYRDADIVVAPMAFGGGTKNKTLEAMAWGKPVVGTPAAFSGVAIREGEAFVCTPLTGDALATAIARLALDPARREEMGRAGRAHVLRYHSQSVVDEVVGAVYARVLAGRR